MQLIGCTRHEQNSFWPRSGKRGVDRDAGLLETDLWQVVLGRFIDAAAQCSAEKAAGLVVSSYYDRMQGNGDDVLALPGPGKSAPSGNLSLQ